MGDEACQLKRTMIHRDIICAGQCDGCDTTKRCDTCGLSLTYCNAVAEMESRRCCDACTHA